MDRTSKYPTQDSLDFTGIEASKPISQIQRVEKQNNLVINVLGWDKGIIIHRLSHQPENLPRINLLLIEKDDKFHYTWVKDLNRLLHDQSKHQERKHCERRFHSYTREDLLKPTSLIAVGLGRRQERGDARKR